MKPGKASQFSYTSSPAEKKEEAQQRKRKPGTERESKSKHFFSLVYLSELSWLQRLRWWGCLRYTDGHTFAV